MKIPALVITTVAALLISGCGWAQTTRTSPSSSSTFKSIPSSSSTSANSPCNPNNPTSPCYSANAPRDPCYSAMNPNEPCSTTITPKALPPVSAPVSPSRPQPLTGSVFTTDQAKSRIEASGYSDVSGLRRDPNGVWQGKAAKDGLTVNVTLGADGKVTAQ